MREAVISVAIKIPNPPQPKGNVVQDIRALYTFLFQMVEIINKNNDSEVKNNVRETPGR